MPTYIVRAGDNGPVKIGWADDVAARVADLQTGHYETLRVIREVDTWWNSEPQFHERFKDRRLRGEWFTFDPEMLTFIPREAKSKRERLLVKVERSESLEEARSLLEVIAGPRDWNEKRHEIHRRLSELTGLSYARIRALFYGDAKRIDIHELEALRQKAAVVRSLPTIRGAAADLDEEHAAVRSGRDT